MIGFKPGSTFAGIITVTVVRDGAEVADLTGWTFASQLRTTSGTLIADLTCTLVSGPLRKLRLTCDVTDGWPESTTVLGDIIATDPTGTVEVITPTFTFQTQRRITHG